jgi:hypothetical protein
MPDDVKQSTDALCGLHNAIVDFIITYKNQPTINSKAITELGDSRYHGAIANAYSQNGMQVLMACDQLDALSRTLTEPTLTIAPWTCVRAIIELAAVASWLIDPKIDVKERVERSFALRFEGLRQQNSFAAVIQDYEAAAAEAMANLEREASRLGVTVCKDAKGKLLRVGERWPKFTDLAKLMLNEEANYRLYSAMTHGHLWAATQLGFSIDTAGASSPLAVSNSVPVTKTLPATGAVGLCSVASKILIQLVDYKSQLFGWDIRRLVEVTSPFSAILAAVFKQVQTKAAARSTSE